MTNLIITLIQGLSLGSIYALIALGYTMVYGIAKMLNFAHGDVIMVGAYMIFSSVALAKLPSIVGIILCVVFSSLLGIIIELLAYKPLRRAPSLSVLITAIGVSYLLQNLALLIFGSEPQAVPVLFNLPFVELGYGIKITGEAMFTMGITVVLMIILTIFINKTKLGKAMRAVSEDKDAALLMGIDVNKTISITFAIGSALAALASTLMMLDGQTVNFTMGSLPGIKAFTAAVIGGIGSIPGAMLGGIVLGLIECFAVMVGLGDYAVAIEFSILIIVLLVKPTGILGKKRREKV